MTSWHWYFTPSSRRALSNLFWLDVLLWLIDFTIKASKSFPYTYHPLYYNIPNSSGFSHEQFDIHWTGDEEKKNFEDEALKSGRKLSCFDCSPSPPWFLRFFERWSCSVPWTTSPLPATSCFHAVYRTGAIAIALCSTPESLCSHTDSTVTGKQHTIESRHKTKIRRADLVHYHF